MQIFHTILKNLYAQNKPTFVLTVPKLIWEITYF